MEHLIQQINLYQPGFRKQREPFGAMMMLAIVGVTVVLLALVSMVSLLQLNDHQQRTVALEAKNEDLQARLEEARQQLQPREPNQLLIAERQRLQRDLRDARRLSRLLNLEMNAEEQRYSEYFLGLASATLDGLWLEQLEVSDNGEQLRLAGRALRAELLPRLLQLLREQEAFAGHSFGEVIMRRDDDAGLRSALQFELQTAATEENQDAG